MPVEVMIEREGYRKFKLSDLNLDISDNSSESARYAASSGRLAPETIHEKRVSVTIQKMATMEASYYYLHDEKVAIILPRKLPHKPEKTKYQPTTEAILRILLSASAGSSRDQLSKTIGETLKSGKPLKVMTREYDFHCAIETARFAEKHNLGGRVSAYSGYEPEILNTDISICRIMQSLIAPFAL